jgi:hypothetical protein
LERICHYGGARAKSETSAVYERVDLFGISNLLDVWISDNSKAAAKLAATYERKRHVLCFQHFRQHLWDAIATFNHQVKKSFWSKVMKIMKWRGYSDDATLLQDINSLIAECEPGSRCRELMIELRDLRRKLCIFHVSQCYHSHSRNRNSGFRCNKCGVSGIEFVALRRCAKSWWCMSILK